jgi:hypothetical protein
LVPPLAIAPSLIVHHQAVNDRLKVIAEPPKLRVRSSEVTTDKPQCEFLKNFVRRIRIPQCPQEIATHGAAVTIEHLLLSGAKIVRLSIVSAPHDGPQCHDLTEVFVIGHQRIPRSERASSLPPRIGFSRNREAVGRRRANELQQGVT